MEEKQPLLEYPSYEWYGMDQENPGEQPTNKEIENILSPEIR